MSAYKERTAFVDKPKADGMTDYVRESLNKVALVEGFVNYGIDFNSCSNVGDGFTGMIFKAVIKERESDEKLELIVKIPPENHDRRVRFGVMEMFEREVFAYTKVLPEFVKIQEERNVKPELRFTQFSKCYFAEYNTEKDESIVIMEDLKERDFVMCKKAVPTSFEHAKLVFTALGRFHALSFALKALKPEVFCEYRQLNDFLLKRLYRKDSKEWLPGKIDRATGTIDENDVQSVNRVSKLKENIEQTLADLSSSDLAEPYAVLGHGDCWYNNFMYKFEVS